MHNAFQFFGDKINIFTLIYVKKYIYLFKNISKSILAIYFDNAIYIYIF